jgi:hypothetical protein
LKEIPFASFTNAIDLKIERVLTGFLISWNIKCNSILCLSSRNMIDKTMCEVLWRNISDFYVNLRVEMGKHPQVILVMYFNTFYQFILNMLLLKKKSNFHNDTMKSKLLLNSKSVRINKLCTDFISSLLKIRKDSISLFVINFTMIYIKTYT